MTRLVLGGFGGIACPLILATDANNAISHTAAQIAIPAMLAIFLCTLVGELLERYLYFAAVVAPKMPGGGG